MDKIKVLIADDHDLVREGICKLLELYEDIEVCGEAEDGLETVSRVRENPPDLVLLDLNMPRMNGLTTISKIKEIKPAVKVLILTIHDEEEYIYEVIKAGAEGYVQKDINPEELKEAIDRVIKGERVFPRSIEEQINNIAVHKPRIEDLSNREREVLELLAEGMSNRKIADTLFISEKTVKNHVSNILKKLSVNDRTQAVIFALKRGLVRLS
jgi:two-component system, NarL family, response regulator DegU